MMTVHTLYFAEVECPHCGNKNEGSFPAGFNVIYCEDSQRFAGCDKPFVFELRVKTFTQVYKLVQEVK